MNNKIEIITCPTGDWEVLKFNGELFADGHSIRQHDWIELLRKLGHEVIETEISDEQMENGDY